MTAYLHRYSKMESFTDNTWARHRRAVELWKVRNRPYYLAQKKKLAARPAYLAHRREKYRRAKLVRSFDQAADLSTIKIYNDFKTADEGGAGRSHFGGGHSEGASFRPRLDPAPRQTEEGPGESGGCFDASG